MKYVSQFPNTTLTIENYTYSFSSVELYEDRLSNISDSLILLNPYDENTWAIGIIFLRQFNSLFDMDNEIVELFCDDGRIHKREKIYRDMCL